MPSTRQRVRNAVYVVLGLLACELGARIALPGLNTNVLRDFIRHDSGGWLRSLYDLMVGGALSRGALLALGIMPYLSARLMVKLARTAWPSLAQLESTDTGQARLQRGTRWLTTGLALVQSIGFARFTQSIPGAVVHPGPAYVGLTVVVLTSGSILMMLLAERITNRHDAEPHRTAEPESTQRDVAPVEAAQVDTALVGAAHIGVAQIGAGQPGDFIVDRTSAPRFKTPIPRSTNNG